jgi:hypothetical protein
MRNGRKVLDVKNVLLSKDNRQAPRLHPTTEDEIRVKKVYGAKMKFPVVGTQMLNPHKIKMSIGKT